MRNIKAAYIIVTALAAAPTLACAQIPSTTSAQSATPSTATVCPALFQALKTYPTLEDVPTPFEKVAFPPAVTPGETAASRVARSGATGSTIAPVADADLTAEDKKAMSEHDVTQIFRTQPVRVFADTARVNAACRSKQ